MLKIDSKNLSTIGLMLLIVALTFYFTQCQKPKTIIVDRIKTDTTYIDKIHIVERLQTKFRTKTNIVYKDRETIETQPFIAQIDTIVNNDTISITYIFPESILDVSIKPKPDSLVIQEKIITNETLKIEKETAPWYENPLYAVGGFVVGVVTGFILK